MKIDPIFKLIEEHQTATRLSKAVPSVPWDGDDSELRAAIHKEDAALLQVLTTRPTTLAGLKAVLAYAGSDYDGWFTHQSLAIAASNKKLSRAGKTFSARMAAALAACQ